MKQTAPTVLSTLVRTSFFNAKTMSIAPFNFNAAKGKRWDTDTCDLVGGKDLRHFYGCQFTKGDDLDLSGLMHRETNKMHIISVGLFQYY